MSEFIDRIMGRWESPADGWFEYPSEYLVRKNGDKWDFFCCSGCHGCGGAPVGVGYETKLDAMLAQIKWIEG